MSTKLHRVLLAFGCSLVVACGQQGSVDQSSERTKDINETVVGLKSFKCEITTVTPGMQTQSSVAFFFDQFAVEFETSKQKEIVSFYDFKTMAFTRVNPTASLSIKDCGAWKATATEHYLGQLDEQSDPAVVRYYKLTLNPKYKVSNRGNDLLMKSDIRQIHIQSQSKISKQQTMDLLAYHRLRTFRRSITEQMIPPSPMLAVNDELRRRGLTPVAIDVKAEDLGHDEKTSFQIAAATDAAIERAKDAMKAVPPEEE